MSVSALYPVLDLSSPNRSVVRALEKGQILFLPDHSMPQHTDDLDFLSPSWLNPRSKNISYHLPTTQLSGYDPKRSPEACLAIQAFMHRYAHFSHTLLTTLCPSYTPHLRMGRTSYRPAEIKGRKTSKRKDDTRLHVDAFAATPVNGYRILRVFCNINPHQAPRVWHVGEPFPIVLQTFLPYLTSYHPLKAKWLYRLKATKTVRSAYDHYMLQLHDRMKKDDHYQQTIEKERIDFPVNSTWIVFTDQVSHAALSGQYLLEQTFYLPVSALCEPAYAPLMELKKYQLV